STITNASVPRDLRVDLDAPRVDPALEVVDLLEALGEEVLGGVVAAPAVVAVERERRVLGQLLEARHRRVVERLREVDLRDVALLRRAHVVQLLDRARVEQRLELLRADLADLR